MKLINIITNDFDIQSINKYIYKCFPKKIGKLTINLRNNVCFELKIIISQIHETVNSKKIINLKSTEKIVLKINSLNEFLLLKCSNVVKDINKIEYVGSSDLYEFVEITNNVFSKSPNTPINTITRYPNHFDIDLNFYCKANNLSFNNSVSTIKHIFKKGILNGLLYHPKQLKNIFPNVKIYADKSDLYVDFNNKHYTVNRFLTKYLYSQTYDWYIEQILKKESSMFESELFILTFIGNYEIGINLIKKMSQTKKNFGLGICFRTEDLYLKMKDEVISNFSNYSMYISKEYGNDIIPTLLMYNDINKKIKLNKIIKLQTKTDIKWCVEVSEFLFSGLDNLNKFEPNVNSNCVGPKKYYKHYLIYNMNKLLFEKYDKYIDKTHFVAGTMFYCKKEVFDQLLEIVSLDYKMFFNNNLYDNNEILYDKSPAHTLERLFGIIKIPNKLTDKEDDSIKEISPLEKLFISSVKISKQKKRNLGFEHNFYVSYYPDAYGLSVGKSYSHYKKKSKFEMRIPNLKIFMDLFNFEEINKKLFSSFISKVGHPYTLTELLKEKYKYFDYNFYVGLYANDFKNTQINTYNLAIVHYYCLGESENRVCCYQQIIDNNLKFIQMSSEHLNEQKKIFTLKQKKYSFDILIRTNKRPSSFDSLYKTIISQKYDVELINIYVSYHNIETYEYLKKYENINLVKVEELKTKGDYPYNYYLNDLKLKSNPDSWIIFIDDDDLFVNEYSISTLNYTIQKIITETNSNNFALFWRVKRYDQLVGNSCYNLSELNLNLSLCGFSICSRYSELLNFTDGKVALVINELKNKIPIYWTKFVLTKIGQTDKIAGFGFTEI
jgi:hypothetical protein